MATKTNAYIQYSKRITTLIAVAWICFRVLTICLIAYRPEIAEATIKLQQGADDVMMVAVGFYCGNSVAEKGIIGYFNARKNNTDTNDDESISNG